MPRGIFRRKIDIEAAAFGTARIGHFSVEHRIYRSGNGRFRGSSDCNQEGKHEKELRASMGESESTRSAGYCSLLSRYPSNRVQLCGDAFSRNEIRQYWRDA